MSVPEITRRGQRTRGQRLGWLIEQAPRSSSTERLFEPPVWRWARAGDVGWWVRADWENALIGTEGLRLDEWRRDGRLTVVKTGPHRVVYRAELPEGAVFVKHFLVPGLRAKVRQWFRRGKGRNEGQRSRYLGAIGVPTITPIALGEQRKRKFLFENYLITHAIPETIPLDEFVEQRMPLWSAARQARVRQKLASALAWLTARLHNAGYVHQDFHPGNILVRIEADDEPNLSMIDLDALRVSFLSVGPRHSTILRFSITTSGSGPTVPIDFGSCGLTCMRGRMFLRRAPRAFALGIEHATRAWAERLWRRWGRRCQGTNKYFRMVSRGRSWGVVSRDLDPLDVQTLLADPDAPFAREGTVILKDSRTTTVADLLMPVGGRPRRVIYKRFNRKKWFDPLLTFFRPSRAWQSWQAGQHLASRAIPTPQNLAYLARLRPFGRSLFWYLPHETYLITLKEEDAITLGDYVQKVLPTIAPAKQRVQIQRLTLALARLLRMLHERSLSDRDLKSANLLIVGPPDDPSPRLTIIDLQGVRLHHPLPPHRQIQNLSRLNVSLAGAVGRTRTDALRFLRAYLPWGLSPRNDWKGLWRAVEARSQAKKERNQRLGRRLS